MATNECCSRQRRLSSPIDGAISIVRVAPPIHHSRLPQHALFAILLITRFSMSLQASLPIDLFLSLLLRCSCSDLLRLQQCSHSLYSLLHSDKCVDYLLRQHCQLTASQLSALGQSTQQPCEFLFRLLPCLASVEVHSLVHRSLPPLHRALLAEAVLHSSLSVYKLSLAHEQPTSLLPWMQLPSSPLLRLQLQEIVQLAELSSKITLASLHLPEICLWFSPQAACWQQRWDDYWLAAMHTVGQEEQAEEAKSEYEERSEWISAALERMGDKLHIGRLLDSRILWIGHIQSSPWQPPSVFGYYLGHVRHRQHHVPATLHHNPYTIDAAYSDTPEAECMARRSDVHLDVTQLPVVVADLTASVEGLNGFWLHVYGSLDALLMSTDAAGHARESVVRRFIEQIDGAVQADSESDNARHGVVASTAERNRWPLYMTCFPGSDRPRWQD